jgi:hypothetical protein
VLRTLLLPLLTCALLAGRPAPASAAPADDAALRASSISAERDKALRERVELQRALEGQLAEQDRLQRQRASWRRDRQLKDKRAEAHATAGRIAAIDQRVRELGARLVVAQRALLAAAEAELRGTPAAERRRRLDGWAANMRRALQPAKKIILPDHRIDPLADPEDLEFQARRIAASEKELEREVEALTRRAERFERMDALRQKRNRASELGSLDDNRPRRSTGRIGTQGERDDNAGLGGFDGDSAPEPGDGAAPPNEDPSGGLSESDPVVVLADVVDAGTIDALRRAESSGDPAARARAAVRAKSQVSAQLERLRKTREAIARRVRQLRGGK